MDFLAYNRLKIELMRCKNVTVQTRFMKQQDCTTRILLCEHCELYALVINVREVCRKFTDITITPRTVPHVSLQTIADKYEWQTYYTRNQNNAYDTYTATPMEQQHRRAGQPSELAQRGRSGGLRQSKTRTSETCVDSLPITLH